MTYSLLGNVNLEHLGEAGVQSRCSAAIRNESSYYVALQCTNSNALDNRKGAYSNKQRSLRKSPVLLFYPGAVVPFDITATELKFNICTFLHDGVMIPAHGHYQENETELSNTYWERKTNDF